MEPRTYRLRILNGCGSRFLNLKFDNGLTFTQIGTDGGFLPAPVEVGGILLAPAERADVIVDFSGLRGQRFLLINTAPDEPFGGLLPDPDNPDAPPPPDPDTTGQVMQISVDLPLSGRDNSEVPAFFPFARLLESEATNTRDVTLNENLLITGSEEFPISALLGTSAQGLGWEENITENPRSGSTEIWRIINTTEDTHPIHLHLVQFQILDRIPFDVEAFLANRPTPGPIENYYTGAPVPPTPNEAGRKDTVRANPGEVARIIAKFDLPSDVAPPAEYVWHCHILEHFGITQSYFAQLELSIPPTSGYERRNGETGQSGQILGPTPATHKARTRTNAKGSAGQGHKLQILPAYRDRKGQSDLEICRKASRCARDQENSGPLPEAVAEERNPAH